ncbi:PASTA domain-containing protein [Rhodococcus sp. 05-2255-3B1]|nr:PASTA domain-containing protein [Rhodococcus sp. 05-339-2]OZE03237.1 PASTA domain-containing protein [Rhodococcus sp. 05-2255-3C]OZE09626.1 PASTA domain-containing protein [Rhodococcus sp. 05-2255-3B1]OZE14892.1 PASTA domain-containing protein [Rhodococcus sp. 05-2255-2A2]
MVLTETSQQNPRSDLELRGTVVFEDSGSPEENIMRIEFKKAVATVALTGAIALGGGAVAQAAPDRERIPDVIGMSQSAAIAALEDAGFDNVTVNYDRPDARVIGLNFPVGVKVSENAEIKVIVISD